MLAHHDHLLYAYLDVFHTVRSGPVRNSVNFIVTGRVRPLFNVLHDAFIRRQLDSLDPFLVGQYGHTMSAWGESRWLYWYGPGLAVPVGPKVWFLTPEEFDPAEIPTDAAILPIGRVKDPRDSGAAPVDTTPWTGHSDQVSLAEGVRAFEAAGHDVVLFRNFRKRLAKFARDYSVAATPLTIEARSIG